MFFSFQCCYVTICIVVLQLVAINFLQKKRVQLDHFFSAHLSHILKPHVFHD